MTFDVDKFAELSAAAPAGPWKKDSNLYNEHWSVVNNNGTVFDDGTADGEYDAVCSGETRDFIIYARNHANEIARLARRAQALESAALTAIAALKKFDVDPRALVAITGLELALNAPATGGATQKKARKK